ncbi:hypothetical protein [Bradyrhizobium sp.]|uniref:hypothetical protein n=1 Tax=Bradyrhizobium sp. TaxID=376 RepID=UPI000B2EDA67|nr:hypothetical protein [Bradyrhizobium sp.]
MNWEWASSLDQFWRSPTFPMWLTLGAAGFFGIIVLIIVLRAEKSVANGMLAVITLLAIGTAGAATIGGFGPGDRSVSGESAVPSHVTAALPALSCIDELAGEAVLTACEKSLFGSAESTAAALSYAAAQITRLTSLGDVASANKDLKPELQALRRAVERDRYGLMAYVLIARDRCTPSNCPAFRSLTDRQQLVSNMDERVYDGLVMRYSASWNASPPTAAAPIAALAPSMPTGKPTNADFPSAASTPPVNIMTPEPTTAPAPRAPAALANAPLPSPRPPASATAPAPAAPSAAPPSLTAAKKQPAPKQRPAAPVQLAPAATGAAGPAPATEDE